MDVASLVSWLYSDSLVIEIIVMHTVNKNRCGIPFPSLYADFALARLIALDTGQRYRMSKFIFLHRMDGRAQFSATKCILIDVILFVTFLRCVICLALPVLFLFPKWFSIIHSRNPCTFNTIIVDRIISTLSLLICVTGKQVVHMDRGPLLAQSFRVDSGS